MVPKHSFKGYCFVFMPKRLLSSYMVEGSLPDTTVVLITNAHPPTMSKPVVGSASLSGHAGGWLRCPFLTSVLRVSLMGFPPEAKVWQSWSLSSGTGLLLSGDQRVFFSRHRSTREAPRCEKLDPALTGTWLLPACHIWSLRMTMS